MKKDIALSYAKRNWKVLPLHWTKEGVCSCGDNGCKSAGKHPYFRLAPRGLKNATDDEGVIESWWDRFPSCNIGVVMGKASGIIALDIDTKDGKVGEESYRELSKKFGQFPETVEFITWSGGRQQLYLAGTHKIKSTTGRIAQDIDVRGEGGYSVMPGSEIFGRAYEWDAGACIDEIPIAALPENMIRMLNGETKPRGFEGNEDEEHGFSLPERIEAGTRDATFTALVASLVCRGYTNEQIREEIKRVFEERTDKEGFDPFPKIKSWIQSAREKFGKEEPIEAKKIKFDGFFNDMWNAKQFYEQFKEQIRFVYEVGSWFIWDGKRWKRDKTNKILHLARKCVKSFYKKAFTDYEPDSPEQKAFFKWIQKSGEQSKLNAMIKIVTSFDGVSVEFKEFDQDDNLFNCNNGTLNLNTFTLQPHNQADMITKICPVDYSPTAKHERWSEFLAKVFTFEDGHTPDHELIRFMQRKTGSMLTGVTTDRVISILFGDGHNGKSTYIRNTFSILADYGTVTDPDTLLYGGKNKTTSNDLADLYGVRGVYAIEPDDQKKIDEARVKKMTGNDMLKCRFLFKEYFSYMPKFKVFLATNHKPEIHGTDDGIWGRVRLVPFNRKFSPQDADFNPNIDKVLEKEAEGIFAWLVEGCRVWRKEGLGTSESIERATLEYRAESDSVGNFLKDTCEFDETASVQSQDLLDAYKSWASRTKTMRVSRNDFYRYMKKKGFVSQDGRLDGRRANYFFGISLIFDGKNYRDWNDRNDDNDRPPF